MRKISMVAKYIKPSQYAEIVGLNYRTVVKYFHTVELNGFISHTGRIFVENPNFHQDNNKIEGKKAILYARVSSTVNKGSLDGQIERLRAYASAKGYQVVGEYKEIASGLNDKRRGLSQIFKRDDYNILLAEHKDRLTRFGFNYISSLLYRQGIMVEVINKIESKDKEIMDDFISIITSFCGKIYGVKRRAKTQKIIEGLYEN